MYCSFVNPNCKIFKSLKVKIAANFRMQIGYGEKFTLNFASLHISVRFCLQDLAIAKFRMKHGGKNGFLSPKSRISSA